MNPYKEIKYMLNNIQVVTHYLGEPKIKNSSGYWYISPFRKEKTASFVVNYQRIHDFGDGKSYDIISFVAEYFKISSYNALKVLSKDFNINLFENNSEELIKLNKQKYQEEQLIKSKINEWFYNKYDSLCNQLNTIYKQIKKCKPYNLKLLNILKNRQFVLEYYTELFVNANERDKEILYMEAHNDNRRKGNDIA